MKYFILLPLLFSGCLYFNDTGVSTHLYDNCKEYYDTCGNYRRECPENLIDYKEMQKRVQTLGQTITGGSSEEDQFETGACVEPATDTF